MTGAAPLVTIGIPTYNRSASLEHAIGSALAQDYGALEVVVSDDASRDDTAAMVRGLARDDARLRLVVQPVNLGHARNFQAVLEASRGEYFMWLSDDDRLEPGYVSRCVEMLRDDGAVLVCGLARYHAAGRYAVDERPTDLLSLRSAVRVLAYFARVNVNGALFGVARRRDLLEVGFVDSVGGDWRLVSALAARGRIRTRRDVHIHRSLEGLSSDAERLARSFGMTGPRARHHHVVLAWRLAREILIGGPAYGRLPLTARVTVAPLVALLIVARFPGVNGVRRALDGLGLATVEPRVTAWIRRRD